MNIALHGRNFKLEAADFIQEMFDELTRRNVQILASEQFYKFLKKNRIKNIGKNYYKTPQDLNDIDFFFSLGGDGTLLESVTHIGEREIPILGINTGRLGFLATTSPDDIKNAISNIFNGYYTFDYRALIHLETSLDIFQGVNFGLNEFTVTKRDSSSMIVVHTYINGEYLNSYWADGLIVSTPTGSTGYSLSCGGPVILPQSENFVLTPVSPHNLTVRPMVISDDSVISLEIEGRSKNFLVSLDSRSRVIDASIELAVSKEKFRAKLIKLNDKNFLTTLRSKLNWGFDVRNY
jgi:NAD+ kinase